MTNKFNLNSVDIIPDHTSVLNPQLKLCCQIFFEEGCHIFNDNFFHCTIKKENCQKKIKLERNSQY